MDRRRFTRAALIGAAAVSAAACAQQQPRIAAVSQSGTFAYTAADLECMARAMYFESNRSSRNGMLAVGTVIANRVNSGRYGATVCDVVGARRQFAPGVMSRTMTGPSADLARQTAGEVLSGQRHTGVKSATHFHTAGMRFPYPNMHYVLVAGGNAFYEKRDSSGGGRAANARSLAVALAHAKADSQGIQIAAATPLEHPLPETAAVAVTAKSGSSAPAAVVPTQVAATRVAAAPAAKPGVAPSAIQIAAAPAPSAGTVGAPNGAAAADTKTVVVASGGPAAARRGAPAKAAPVAVASGAAAPVVVASVETRRAAPRSQVARASVTAQKPVAYAEAEAPAVVLPTVKPAPKRVIKVDRAEPALASVAPVAKPAAAKPAVAAKESAPAPVELKASVETGTPVETAPSNARIASAFDAFR